jgi:hypothetical protein
MQAPTKLLSHKAVEHVESGSDAGSDYKYFVYLKSGFIFTEGKCSGTNATCCGVNSYSQFISLVPKESVV